MFLSLKQKLYRLIENTTSESKVGNGYDMVMISVITLNVLFLCLETVPDLKPQFYSIFYAFELFSILLFTLEYLIRLWICTENPAYRHSIYGRLRYMGSFMSIVDICSFLPFYLFLYEPNAKFLAIIRLLRLIRLVKLAEYSKALFFLGRVFKKRKDELLTTGFLTFILLICASSVMYLLEHEAQPHQFSSIPMAMWWGVTALTTVGYGDIYPVTPLGKVFACIVAILGVGVFALPAGLLGASFLEEVQSSKFQHLEELICSHCGKILTIDSRKDKRRSASARHGVE